MWLSICFAARVAVTIAYLTLTQTRPELAARLVVPFGVLVLAVALYDLLGALRRARHA